MFLFFWILLILAIYVTLVFVVARLVAPFYGFKNPKVPESLPAEIKKAIVELEAKSSDQQSYLQAVYDLVLDKTLYQWKHTRFKAGIRLSRGFVKDLSEIWSTQDFIYCTAINYVSFVLLTGSKYFQTSDVKVRHVFLNFVAHQYLQVKVGEKWIDFDPSGSGIRGKKLGTHASIFG
jgi:hypothetical protein